MIKTIFRLSSHQLSHTWTLVETGPVDAWITDSASWQSDQAHRQQSAGGCPILYLSRLQHAGISPVLVRPIRAQALVQWLEETAQALQQGEQSAPVDTHEQEQWAATEPVGLSFLEQASEVPAPIATITQPASVQASERASHTAAPESLRRPEPAMSSPMVVMQQLDPESRYMLRRWPPAQIMGNDPKRLRITSLLSKQALQVDELSDLSGASVEECEGWMSTLLHSEFLDTRAASVVGAVPEVPATLSTKKVVVPTRTSSLVSAIRRRLGI